MAGAFGINIYWIDPANPVANFDFMDIMGITNRIIFITIVWLLPM